MKSLWCVGRNFAQHAKELGNAVPKEPVIFLKSPACLAIRPKLIYPIPEDVHFECEIVARINADCSGYDAMSIGLDLTLRDRQSELKKQGLPWTAAKCFPQSAAVAEKWWPVQGDKLTEVAFALKINQEVRQQARLSEALFCPKTVLLHLQKQYPLSPGDYVFLGTPSGVGPLTSGDQLELLIEDNVQAVFEVEAAPT